MKDFDFVSERLAVGGAVQTADDVRVVVAARITHVIDCWAEEDHTWRFRGSGVNCMRPPPALDDGTPKPPAWFDGGLAFALQALARPGTRVLAHCRGGINRGPSMGYAILRAQGIEQYQAEQAIRCRRPNVRLRYIADAEAALAALGWL